MLETNETPTSTDGADAPVNDWEWAVVEVFGHRRHVGRTREEDRFGLKMLRVDVPNLAKNDDGELMIESWSTHFYAGAAIFSFSLTDEASAMRANRPYEAAALIAWRDRDDEQRPDRHGDDETDGDEAE